MEMKGKKFVLLYLTDWQMRMIEKYLGVSCHRWLVPVDSGSVVKYGVGEPGKPKLKKMYFTDWQKREIRDEAGECCDYVELEDGLMPDYGVFPES